MKKRILSIVLTLCMVLMFVPQTVFAEGETSSTPSVSAYATKEQLMDGTFAPDSNGTATNKGKLVFGKNENGNEQEWYILGRDTEVSGDNTIIFTASPIATGQMFEDNSQNNKTDSSLWSDCDYNGVSITKVYPNHYGASDLRVALQGMATNTSYFTTAEQGLMNATTVTTNDMKNSVTYTTTDKLYALQGDWDDRDKLWAGTSDSTVLAMSSYWSNGSWFWLRSPSDRYDDRALLAYPSHFVYGDDVDASENAVQPASNLNLSSVLFASAATAASSETAEAKTIASTKAMTLRLDGTDKKIGTVTYNTTTGDIKAVKGSTTGDVALVVQGNDGTNDWYYSKQITGTETVNVSAIEAETNTPISIDLSTCKIWLEITDTDELIYAVNATEVAYITSVAITGIETPTSNTTLDTEASCATTGVSSTAPQIAWTPNDSTAGYNTSYTASITLTADTGYEFTDPTTATVMGNAATSVTKNDNGTLTVTYTFPEIPDTVDPVISGVEDGKTYCSAQTVTVSDNDAIKEVTVNGTKVTLDEYNQFTRYPASGTQTIIAIDKAGNRTTVTVTINDGHTYGEWQSNGNGMHIRYCTVAGCSGYEDGECTGGEATCTVKAECAYCGEEYGELDSSNHNLVNTPAKDATVIETGNIEYWQCENCDKYFSDENGENEISLEDTVIQKLPPEIIKGKGQSVAEREKKALSFTSNAAYSDFIRVELDGKTLDAKNYTVKEGSTVVTLKADYVATLSAGEHTIGIVSTNGTATTTFTVNAKAVVDNDTKSPQTGDNSHMALWIALLFMSGAGVIGTTVYGKKKRAK